MRIAPGIRLGDLEVIEEVGRGAFATVFLARDTLVDRTVALKVMRMSPAITTDVERTLMLREARLAGKLISPHIVVVYGVHDLGARGLAVEMEYVEGPSLADVLAGGRALHVDESLRILRGVLNALHIAHEHGIIHRDVKPGNILLGERDGAIKLTDFGLGRQIGEASLSVSSLDGFLGTPNYVAPEVIEGAEPTPLTDIWSAGVVAYQMVEGRLPFSATSLPEVLEAITTEDPAPLEAPLPAGLARVILAAMSRDPARRPQGATRMLASLGDLAPAS